MALAERSRWYARVYRTMYRLRLPVWDRSAPVPDLVALVEGPEALPPGRALDIGCGAGTDSVYLARRGRDVTGVDMVPRALALARRRAAAAGVAPRFVEGDATRLGQLGIGTGYGLLLDFGCFHTLPADRRPARRSRCSASPGRRPWPRCGPGSARRRCGGGSRAMIGRCWTQDRSTGASTCGATACAAAIEAMLYPIDNLRCLGGPWR